MSELTPVTVYRDIPAPDGASYRYIEEFVVDPPLYVCTDCQMVTADSAHHCIEELDNARSRGYRLAPVMPEKEEKNG